jgi:ABC-type antimicrobial peptide transport system permease subunit
MFKLNLKIALRNLWKHKVYTFINVAGLSVGMAGCILIFIFIRYQLSYDDDFNNKDRIYRVVSNWKYKSGTDASQGVPIPLAAAIRNDIPQLEKVAAIQRSTGVLAALDQAGQLKFKDYEAAYFAQPEFFEIFNFNWLSGDPKRDLFAPNTVALSEKAAIKYFGDWRNALGKTLRFQKNEDCRITAIFKDRPENTSLPLEVVFSYATFSLKDDKNFGTVRSSSECYVLLKRDAQFADAEAALAKFNETKYKDNDESGQQYHTFQSLQDIHHNGRYGNFAGKIVEKTEIYSLSIIGLFLILTACINFINLATAQAIGRSKEVGIRKVLGGERRQLIIQFLSETLAVSVIAMLIACVLTEAALPYMQQLFDEKISFSLLQYPVIFVFLLGLVALVSLLAGFYPALIISGFNPALAIKNKINANSNAGLGLRRILLVLQFTITTILVIATLVVLKQMNYMREKPLGFDTEAVAVVSLPADSLNQQKHENFKARLLTIPGLRQISFCDVPPSSSNVSESDFSLNGTKNKDFQIRTMHVDQHYFETFGIELIAGKALPKSDTANAFVVNETFLKRNNIVEPEKALGKLLTINDVTAPIVGVSKDFNDKSLHEQVSPIAISSNKWDYYNMAIKMDRPEVLQAMRMVEQLWNETFPNDVYDASFVNDDLEEYYDSERIMGVLFRVFSLVIIFISFVGLFGLISFVTTQRTREVAIRKVLGASTYEVVRLLNGSFLLLVFLANLFAWPLAYILINKWLSQYAYRIELSIWPFLAAMFISMLITLLTVSLRSLKVAGTNPVDALKYE